MRNIAIFKDNTPKTKQESGQKAGNTPRKQGTTQRARPPAQVDTPKGRQPTTSAPVFLPCFQKYIRISRLSVSQIPDKTPSTPKNLFTFAPFCPVSDAFCPDDRRERERPEDKRGCRLYGEHRTRDTPPYCRSDKCPSSP